jgi:hypothetical protein
MMGELWEYLNRLAKARAFEHRFAGSKPANCDGGMQSGRDNRVGMPEPAGASVTDPQTASAANSGPQANETATVHLRADLHPCRRLLRGGKTTKVMRPPSNP